MKIPEVVLNKWNEISSYGDQKKIADATGLTQADISRAILSGECRDEVFEAIAKFLKEKETLIKELL